GTETQVKALDPPRRAFRADNLRTGGPARFRIAISRETTGHTIQCAASGEYSFRGWECRERPSSGWRYFSGWPQTHIHREGRFRKSLVVGASARLSRAPAFAGDG